MISFKSDYVAGAHPKILQKLLDINSSTFDGYGEDEISARAKEKIKKAFSLSCHNIFFIAGGTQTNEIVISTVLKDYEGVISPKTGHIACHEAGAIEYTNHKVIELPSYEGKLKALDVDNYIETFYCDENHEHMVFPGMVYISFPTEYGTIYSKKELEDLHLVCKKYNIPLFLDGARLAYGLMSRECDIKKEELKDLVDIFYIGGTKVGAYIGEAVVFSDLYTPTHFVNRIKKRGALLAKGWLTGAQFDTLFDDDLYFEIGRNAIYYAEKLKEIFSSHNIKLFIDSPTNQQFVILDNEKIKELEGKVGFGFWEKYDDTKTVVRFATGHQTKQSDIDYLDSIL